MITIILSSLALLAAIAAITLCLQERKRNQERNTALLQLVDARKDDVLSRVTALENGAVPDFEKAKQAAAAVNNFNDGITGILGFDPYEALRMQRNKERGVNTDV